MLDYLARISLKKKITLSFMAVLSILMFTIVSALNSLTEVHEKMTYVVNEIQPAMSDSMELINTLQGASSSMGFYLLAQGNR